MTGSNYEEFTGIEFRPVGNTIWWAGPVTKKILIVEDGEFTSRRAVRTVNGTNPVRTVNGTTPIRLRRMDRASCISIRSKYSWKEKTELTVNRGCRRRARVRGDVLSMRKPRGGTTDSTSYGTVRCQQEERRQWSYSERVLD
jgi:hypothetical protein